MDTPLNGNDFLKARGIFEIATGIAQWRIWWREGWMYPVWDIDGTQACLPSEIKTPGTGNKIKYKIPVPTEWNQRGVYRWKSFGGQKPKYLWTPEGLDIPPGYYCLPGIKQAITDAGGVVYRASGEPDVLAYHAAGIPNAMSFAFGEGMVYGGLGMILRRLGVKEIRDFPDRDETGRKGVSRIQTTLSNAGLNASVRYVVSALPESLGEKGDINKLWQAVKFSRDEFNAALKACPEIQASLPEIVSKPAPPVVAQSVSNQGHPENELDERYYEDIARALGVTGYKDDGWSLPIKCVLVAHEHDNVSPSAGWHREKKIYQCFKCGKVGDDRLLAKDIAPIVGVDFHNYLPQRAASQASSAKTSSSPAPKNSPVTPPAQSRIVPFNQAMVAVGRQVQGNFQGDELVSPLVMPFVGLRRLGGFAKFLEARKIFAVVGDSGDGKTAFVESMIDEWRKRGYHGLMWGAEWTPNEYVARAMVRHTGIPLDRFMANKVWAAELAANVPPQEREGAPFDPAEQAEIDAAQKAIAAWKADLGFLDTPNLNMALLREAATAYAEDLKKQGIRLRYIVWDHAQLVDLAIAGSFSELNRAVLDFKQINMALNTVGIVTSQITKQDARNATTEQVEILKEAMNGISSMAFNLVVSLNRLYHPESAGGGAITGVTDGSGTSPRGITYHAGVANVSKNNGGQKGRQGLAFRPERMQWLMDNVPLVAKAKKQAKPRVTSGASASLPNGDQD